MKNFRDLKVWEKAHRFTLEIYNVTKKFPGEEKFGLISQIRRASLSIPSNIAEGCGRDGGAEFARFLTIALGSASEAEYQLLLAKDLGFLETASWNRLNDQIIEIKRMTTGLLKSIRNKK
ncbi:MAG: four helix bundle protein [Planctomycetaceae bacterium]